METMQRSGHRLSVPGRGNSRARALRQEAWELKEVWLTPREPQGEGREVKLEGQAGQDAWAPHRRQRELIPGQ